MKYWMLRVAGFVIGAGVAVAIEVGLLLLASALTSRQFMPRGLGWIVVPIAFGITAGTAAPTVWSRAQRGDIAMLRKFRLMSLRMRAAIVFSVFWALCVGLYVYLFEPYGELEYMDSTAYHHMFKLMIFPPAVVLIGLALYTKLVAPTTADKDKTET